MNRLVVWLLLITAAGCGGSGEDVGLHRDGSSEHAQALSARGGANEAKRPLTKTKLAGKYLDEGAASFKSHKYRKALDAFTKAIDVEPKNPYLWEALGDLCLVRDALERAEQAYKQAYKLDRKNPYWRFKLGNVHLKMGKRKEAEKELKSFIARSADPASAYISLGDLYIQEHDYAKADPVLQKAVKRQPRNPEAHFLLGQVYEWRKMDKKALREYFKAYSLNPKSVIYVYRLATTLERLGMHEDANEYFRIHKELYGKQLKGWKDAIRKQLDSGGEGQMTK